MENIATTTPFSMIYDSFLSKITDDMYMELTELDTFRLLEELLDAAMHKFEFPRFDITDFEEVVRLDREYIQNWSVMLDLKILLKTVGVVLRHEGAE